MKKPYHQSKYDINGKGHRIGVGNGGMIEGVFSIPKHVSAGVVELTRSPSSMPKVGERKLRRVL